MQVTAFEKETWHDSRGKKNGMHRIENATIKGKGVTESSVNKLKRALAVIQNKVHGENLIHLIVPCG